MLERRNPNRTKTESPAQPMAEQMAMISANKNENSLRFVGAIS
jgi:hypothetical protein